MPIHESKTDQIVVFLCDSPAISQLATRSSCPRTGSEGLLSPHKASLVTDCPTIRQPQLGESRDCGQLSHNCFPST